MGGIWTPLIVVNGDIIYKPDKWTSAMKWFWNTTEKEYRGREGLPPRSKLME